MSAAEVIPLPLHEKATWDAVRESWECVRRLGWGSVVAAIRTGDMLRVLKEKTDHGEFLANSQRATNLSAKGVENLMKLSRHQLLLEQHKPDSQRAALALIPMNRAKKKPKGKPFVDDDQERIEPEDDEDEENYRTAYWLRVDAAIRFAVYARGPVDREMARRARACAAAWEKLARKLENAL